MANQIVIDVSGYQDNSINYFKTFKNRGVFGVIAKIGGRGGGEGNHYKNPNFYGQIINSDAVGLQNGGYWWGQFGNNTAEALYHAKLTIGDVTGILAKGSFIGLDYEAGASNSIKANTDAIIVYMDYIKACGYQPGLYSGSSYMRTYIDIDRIVNRYGSVIWPASYPTTAPVTAPNMNYFPSMNGVALWQFTDNFYSVDASIMLIDVLTIKSSGKKEDINVSHDFSKVNAKDYWTYDEWKKSNHHVTITAKGGLSAYGEPALANKYFAFFPEGSKTYANDIQTSPSGKYVRILTPNGWISGYRGYLSLT